MTYADSTAQALPSPVIFDPGIPDIMSYLTLCGLSVPTHVAAAAKTACYNTRALRPASLRTSRGSLPLADGTMTEPPATCYLEPLGFSART